MELEKPFRMHNAQYDAQGNVVIVRLHPAPANAGAGCPAVRGSDPSTHSVPQGRPEGTREATGSESPRAPARPASTDVSGWPRSDGESRGDPSASHSGSEDPSGSRATSSGPSGEPSGSRRERGRALRGRVEGHSTEEPCLVLHIPFRESSEKGASEGALSPFRARKIRSTRFRLLHSARERLRAYEEKAPPRVRFVITAGRFLGNFTMVFLFLFVSLNAVSFWEVLQARLLPDARARERHALERVASPLSRRTLLSIPALPTAGRVADSAFVTLPAITPPDNRLIIAKIGKNVPIVEATDAALRRGDWKTFEKDIQDALRFGVVRYPGTAKPGEPGNVFITGHSAYLPWDWGRYKEVFALLSDLEPGDEYSIYYEGGLHRYRVVKKFEVQPEDVSVLEQTPDRRMSTLMTCTPIGTTLRRLIVQAEEIDAVTAEVIAVTQGEGKGGVERPQKLGEHLPGWGNGLPI